MSNTKNLGQVSGIFIGTSSPKNTSIIWYDNTPSQKCHKVYDPVINDWKALSPDIVSNTTYSELVVNANKNGLSIGKHYVITDKSNILAIAITSTKVQYHDSLGNILIDDLGTNIQYHVSSGNLLIDDINGVFDVDKNKLIFQFQEQEKGDSTDYLFGKIKVGTKWILSKFSFQSLISKENDNSVSWNNGIFFSFKNTISKILDKSGGVVSYDTYNSKIGVIDKNIENVSKENQTIIENTESLVDKKTTDVAIFNKKLQNNIDITTVPGDVIRGDTLYTIISKFQRWINKFKYATGISLSRNFTDAKSQQYINNNDTVESALGKIQYMLKNPTTSSTLPEDWNTNAINADGSVNERYGAYEKDGYPKAGDSIFYAFAKIVDFIKDVSGYAKISDGWGEMDYEKEVEYPKGGDNFDTIFRKLVAKLRQLGEISYHRILTDTVDFNLEDGKLTLNDLKLSGSEILFKHKNLKFNITENIGIDGDIEVINLTHDASPGISTERDWAGLRISAKDESYGYGDIYDIILNKIKLKEIIYNRIEINVNASDFDGVLPENYNYYVIRGTVNSTTSLYLPYIEYGSIIFIVNLTRSQSGKSEDIYVFGGNSDYTQILVNSETTGMTTAGYFLLKQANIIGITRLPSPLDASKSSYLKLF